MIDAHIHVCPPQLPGVGPLRPLLNQPLETRAAALRQQMNESGTQIALAMGAWSNMATDPLGVAEILRLGLLLPGVYALGVANPANSEAEHLQRVEAVLREGQVKGLKVYLGYLHYPPDAPQYQPYYELAAHFHIPVVFHTGDTYSPRAKLRFAHPLAVDDVAVDHPNVRFVLAHLGNPWLTEAAEVIYKNVNVWADLSGFFVDQEGQSSEEQQDGLSDTRAAIARAFRYAERPNRFLYGSDWPLVQMKQYADFIASCVPELYHPLIFEENARTLFAL